MSSRGNRTSESPERFSHIRSKAFPIEDRRLPQAVPASIPSIPSCRSETWDGRGWEGKGTGCWQSNWKQLNSRAHERASTWADMTWRLARCWSAAADTRKGGPAAGSSSIIAHLHRGEGGGVDGHMAGMGGGWGPRGNGGDGGMARMAGALTVGCRLEHRVIATPSPHIKAGREEQQRPPWWQRDQPVGVGG
jgi:hypothetical protein